MGGQSLGDRQDCIFGGKNHGGALVIWSLRSPWRSFGFVQGKNIKSVDSLSNLLLT
jgi:hypothetical protein